MMYGMDDVFTEEKHCKGTEYLEQGSGKYTRMAVHSKLKATRPATSSFQGARGPSQTQLLEKGCNSVDIDLGFSSSHCTSEANLASVGSKLWAEDPIGAFSVPDLKLDVKSCFNRPKHGKPIQYPPAGCLTSENFAFCQPFNRTNSCDSPVFSNVGPGSAKPDLSSDFRMQGVPLNSSNTGGPHGQTGFPGLLIQGSINGDCKRKSKFPTGNCEQFNLVTEKCIRNDSLFSEDPMTTDGSDPNDKDLECETKDESVETKESRKTTYSTEHSVETSSSVKIHDNSKSKVQY